MIPQGAAAAGTFSSKGLIAGAYADGSETHKTTEEVEAYWMKQIESERASAAAEGRETSLPYGFDQREKMRAAEAKAYGAADAAGGASSAYGGATPGSGAGATSSGGPRRRPRRLWRRRLRARRTDTPPPTPRRRLRLASTR